jgi:hypothetical protein
MINKLKINKEKINGDEEEMGNGFITKGPKRNKEI